MQVTVLGPIEVLAEAGRLEIGTPKQRALLCTLALTPRRPVSVDRIVDLVWGTAPPRSVLPTVHGYVSQLRRSLEPMRSSRERTAVIATRSAGYSLEIEDAALDAHRFETAIAATHERLRSVPATGPSPLTVEELADADRELDSSLALWRGAPYVDLGDAHDAAIGRRRLEDIRALALEDRAAIRLAVGDHARAAVDLDALTTRYPLRERLWELLAIALVRSGRQSEALDVLTRLRHVLDEELGLEPAPALQRLQVAVLRQDAALAWTPPRQSIAAAPPDQPVAAPAGPAVPALAGAAAESDPWPLVEREEEIAQLDSLLELARDGRPGFAVVSGDPGSGKTRLITDLARRARDAGFRVALGRCSQDELAPPLHPWTSVLHDLEQAAAVGADRQAFAAWQATVETVQRSAAHAPLVVVLEDLHWASEATIRALRLLVESTETGRLLVVSTWRTSQVRPTNVLGDLAANLGRRHAVRLELRGLTTDGIRRLHTAITGRPLSQRQARRYHDRTKGNAYLVSEYAQLARRTGAPIEELLASTPMTVTELVSRRLALLPEQTQIVLRQAAALGDELELASLAALAHRSESALLDDLEPALLSGYIRETALDRFGFVNPVVADVLRAQLTVSRAARIRAAVDRRGPRTASGQVPPAQAAG